MLMYCLPDHGTSLINAAAYHQWNTASYFINLLGAGACFCSASPRGGWGRRHRGSRYVNPRVNVCMWLELHSVLAEILWPRTQSRTPHCPVYHLTLHRALYDRNCLPYPESNLTCGSTLTIPLCSLRSGWKSLDLNHFLQIHPLKSQHILAYNLLSETCSHPPNT